MLKTIKDFILTGHRERLFDGMVTTFFGLFCMWAFGEVFTIAAIIFYGIIGWIVVAAVILLLGMSHYTKINAKLCECPDDDGGK